MSESLLPMISSRWSRATSSTPGEWTSDNPARGQCAVTSMLVQDYLGGELLRTTVGGESHYFNRLPDGSVLDLTLGQFGGAWYDEPPVVRDRTYVEQNAETMHRYRLLLLFGL